MSEFWVEIFNHILEIDTDAIKMQNRVNQELERMLIPYHIRINSQKKKRKRYTLFFMM